MTLKLPKDIYLQWGQEEEDQPLQLDIYQSAYLNLTDWTSSRSFGNFWHLYWNARGGASVECEGHRYPLNSRHVFLIPAHTLFSTRLSRPVPHFYVDFTINSHFRSLKHGIYTMPVEYMKEMLPKFIRSETSPARKTVLYSLIWHYLAQLPQTDFHPSETRTLDPRIANAIEIMEKEIGTLNAVGTICKRVKMSQNQFYLLFKRETNKTPQFFLSQLRMARAAYLLEHTDESIDEIALATAFADRYHFSKRFKQKTGMTPVQYRAKRRGKDNGLITRLSHSNPA